jgi:hypothetical protein
LITRHRRNQASRGHVRASRDHARMHDLVPGRNNDQDQPKRRELFSSRQQLLLIRSGAAQIRRAAQDSRLGGQVDSSRTSRRRFSSSLQKGKRLRVESSWKSEVIRFIIPDFKLPRPEAKRVLWLHGLYRPPQSRRPRLDYACQVAAQSNRLDNPRIFDSPTDNTPRRLFLAAWPPQPTTAPPLAELGSLRSHRHDRSPARPCPCHGQYQQRRLPVRHTNHSELFQSGSIICRLSHPGAHSFEPASQLIIPVPVLSSSTLPAAPATAATVA